MAIEHPQRLRTVTSIMSMTGEPDYGQVAPEAMAALMRHRRSTALKPSKHPSSARRSSAALLLRRGGSAGTGSSVVRPSSHPRARAARWARSCSGDRADDLETRLPFLVIHGRADTLIGLSAASAPPSCAGRTSWCSTTWVTTYEPLAVHRRHDREPRHPRHRVTDPQRQRRHRRLRPRRRHLARRPRDRGFHGASLGCVRAVAGFCSSRTALSASRRCRRQARALRHPGRRGGHVRDGGRVHAARPAPWCSEVLGSSRRSKRESRGAAGGTADAVVVGFHATSTTSG